jgi:hypothetical protein
VLTIWRGALDAVREKQMIGFMPETEAQKVAWIAIRAVLPISGGDRFGITSL